MKMIIIQLVCQIVSLTLMFYAGKRCGERKATPKLLEFMLRLEWMFRRGIISDDYVAGVTDVMNCIGYGEKGNKTTIEIKEKVTK